MNSFLSLAVFLLFMPFGEDDMNNNLQSDLATIRQGRILFGHQSVGVNILDGVREIAASAGVEGPRIIGPEEFSTASGAFLADVKVGKNEYPDSKCVDYLRTAQKFGNDGLDVAVMKFCYADFNKRPNVPELFQLYRRTVDSLRAAMPHLVIVHSTVPLTARTALWRRAAKWVIGREDMSDVGNIMRKEYNDLLRQHYSNDPIFDVAAVESTLPDGTRSSFESDDKIIYTLYPEYASDGRHLNQLGRKVVAEEFIRVLARALAEKKDSPVVGVRRTITNDHSTP